MKVAVLTINTSRGQLDDIDHEVVDIDGPLWPWARQQASWARQEASSYMREFHSPACKIPGGGYSYAAGEDRMVAIVPEGHPAFGLDYANLANWNEAEVDDMLKMIGEG